MSEPVLAARDGEDLDVLSAKMQDAVARLGDFVYSKKQRHFAGLFNRFKWEAGKRLNVRVRAGLHFEGVMAVRSRNLRLGAEDAVVELLTIRFVPAPDAAPAGTVELIFADNAVIELDVECLEAFLSDEPGAWAARSRPSHEGV